MANTLTMHDEFTDYAAAILLPLLAHPENFSCVRFNEDQDVLLIIDVHKDDMGRIIGREGNTAKAIRTLVRAFGKQRNAHISLKINEPPKPHESDSDKELID